MKHYIVGDSIRVNFCGDDMFSSTSGRVVYSDNEHLIVYFKCYGPYAAYGLNRDSMTDSEVENIIGQPIETLRKNKDDVFIDMKAPHTHLPIDRFGDGHEWAGVWQEEMFWDNLVLNEPINGFTVVEQEGKFNFIDQRTDAYLSDLWFDRAINWVRREKNVPIRVKRAFDSTTIDEDKPIQPRVRTIEEIYTVVQLGDTCYKIIKDSDFIVTELSPVERYSSFEKCFKVKQIRIKDIINKSVCKVNDRWYLTSSLLVPFLGMDERYTQRDKDSSFKMDKQWWYFLCTSNCAELSIGMYDGKYGLFPLMCQTGMQHGDYYSESYPFIYDSVKVFDGYRSNRSDEEQYGYIAVEENSKWGLFKLTGFPVMQMERIAESIYPDPETIFSELGIVLSEYAHDTILREETDE